LFSCFLYSSPSSFNDTPPHTCHLLHSRGMPIMYMVRGLVGASSLPGTFQSSFEAPIQGSSL
jgi:hypothetical protein